jgi:hypothetical protein
MKYIICTTETLFRLRTYEVDLPWEVPYQEAERLIRNGTATMVSDEGHDTLSLEGERSITVDEVFLDDPASGLDFNAFVHQHQELGEDREVFHAFVLHKKGDTGPFPLAVWKELFYKFWFEVNYADPGL